MSQGDLDIQKGAIIGRLKIQNLQNEYTFMPIPSNKQIFSEYTDHTSSVANCNLRFQLSEKISNLVNIGSNTAQNDEVSSLHENQQRQIYITRMVKRAKIHPASLPRGRGDKLTLNFNDLLQKLNTVLVAQYLQKENLGLSKSDLILIQESDSQLSKIKERIYKEDDNLDGKFCVVDDILWKKRLIFDQVVHRLCLPSFLGREVIQKLHNRNHCHIGGTNLHQQFGDNFYTPDAEKWIKRLSQSCLFCRLNENKRTMKTKGSHKEIHNNLIPGKVWGCDVLYMPRSSSGYRYILTLCETLTSYICAIPIKTLKSKPVTEAFRMFLGIMPQMSEIITDHGVSDFNSNFTALCEMMGIEHSGSTPRRSQSNGVTEIGNKLLQQQLGRICASTEGRKMWDVSLPKCIQALNQFYPYKSKLSRVQLLFSPFYFCATGGIMGLANPIKFQKFNFKSLNDHRIRNLLNQRISDKRYEFKLNQFVTMENQPQKGENSSKLNIPLNAQVYKIVDIHKQGFQYTLLNIATGARQEVIHSKIKKLRLDDLEAASFAQPNLFNKLVDLRKKLRNTYVAGTKTGNKLYQIPFSETLSGIDPDRRNQQAEDDEMEDEGKSEEDDEPEVVEIFRPSFDHPQPEMEMVDQQEPVAENKRVTRYMGKKHVKIYELSLNETSINNGKIYKPIIESKAYHLGNNFDTALFRGESKSSFFARKRALTAHKLICLQPFCDTCTMASKVKDFEFTPSNLSRYNTTIECTERRRISGKKVCFTGKFNQKILAKRRINLNLVNLIRACETNISFEELRILKN